MVLARKLKTRVLVPIVLERGNLDRCASRIGGRIQDSEELFSYLLGAWSIVVELIDALY